MDEQALKELPVRVNTRPLEFVRRIDLDPNRVDPSKIWVICKDYPRDAKTALVYRVPASVLHERENAIEIFPPANAGGAIVWADIRIAAPQ